MTSFAISFKSLTRALAPLSKAEAIITLRCLKEAVIRDQSFEAACLLRDMERRHTGGQSGINAARPRTKNKAPRTRRGESARHA